MGCSGRDELDPPALLMAPEDAGDVLPPVVEKTRAGPDEALEIQLRASMPGRLVPGAALLALAEADQRDRDARR